MKFPTLNHAAPAMDPMSLSEYLDFCWDLLKDANPDHLKMQKESEERIEKAFRITGEQGNRGAGEQGVEEDLRRET